MAARRKNGATGAKRKQPASSSNESMTRKISQGFRKRMIRTTSLYLDFVQAPKKRQLQGWTVPKWGRHIGGWGLCGWTANMLGSNWPGKRSFWFVAKGIQKPASPRTKSASLNQTFCRLTKNQYGGGFYGKYAHFGAPVCAAWHRVRASCGWSVGRQDTLLLILRHYCSLTTFLHHCYSLTTSLLRITAISLLRIT